MSRPVARKAPAKAAILKGAEAILTMDGESADAPFGVELHGADILIRGGVIEAVGQGLYADDADLIRVQGCVVTPGLVNTHHHLFQTLTRAVPAAQDALLFGWLQTLYPIWARMQPEDFYISAAVGLAELACSGCTTSSDHLYLFPNGARLDDTISAARDIGLRLHATRGAMSIGESAGGLPPDALVEGEAAILEDSIRVIDAFHDPAPGAMTRVGVAPCSPFSVSRELMRDAALLARDKGVMLHTHLAENDEDIAYSLEKFGCRPGQYAEDLGWTGADVWHAHCVKLDGGEIDLFARSGTGVAHCPCSNCRLGSGIAPVRAMRDAGVKVGLGVDGSASNDGGALMAEARMAMLLQRVSRGADAMAAREALWMATRGGAEVLGRDDIGRVAPGLRADLAVWDVSTVETAGSWDPAALALAGPREVRHLFVEGRQVIRDGWLSTLDAGRLAQDQARALARLRG
ncbi:8-oxoguanine deaminase [Frigidibacter sp. ROC022]|uniref:8-oxoguanine deaminase n=1 Tax=Frigidibacter sp. ROC022 TaxID=2971796 RepID=UPI00215AA8B4|nr:8-oxoguanine deaminase [Frigidibacter sp. ROC022]MCR8726756.1 8-oxoguanine deaminase [Frigidibacter sp. ROC022]